MYSDDAIDRACEAVMPQKHETAFATVDDNSDTFHAELRETLWLAWQGGMTLQKLLGEVRREYIEAAKIDTDSKKQAADCLNIDVRTLYRTEQGTHKF